ncbi:MAG: hypothetical protein R2788_15910 [Saprospiraceae bacterium]
MTDSEPANTVAFLSGTEKYFLELNIEIDVEAEIKRLEEEKKYLEGFINSVQKKLDNERFVSGAPAAVVEKERQKLADGLERLRLIDETLKQLK